MVMHVYELPFSVCYFLYIKHNTKRLRRRPSPAQTKIINLKPFSYIFLLTSSKKTLIKIAKTANKITIQYRIRSILWLCENSYMCSEF